MSTTKSKIAAYNPLGLRLEERFYNQDDIDRLIDAAGQLPAGRVTVDTPNQTGAKWIKRRVSRRTALALKLESVAHAYVLDAELQKKPSDSAQRDAFEAIERAAGRLLDALGMNGETDPDKMPQQLKSGLTALAELHGERIGGYPDLPPKEWPMTGDRYVDYWGRAKLRQAVEDLILLRKWAAGARNRAAAMVKLNSPRRARHVGDKALNDWLRDLAGIWLDVYERRPGTSVGAPGRKNEGKGGGPFVRFIEEALRPVLGEQMPTTDQIRDRVKVLFSLRRKSDSKKS